MRIVNLVGLALGVSLVSLPVASQAATQTYTFTSDDCTNGCGPNGQGSNNNNFGSVVVTDGLNGGTTLSFVVTLNSPLNFVGSGLDASFALALDKSGATFSFPTLTIGAYTWTSTTGSLHVDGLGTFGNGTTSFGYGYDITPNGGTTGITSLSFTLTLAAGLTLADLVTASGGSWFGADAASILGLGGNGNTGAIDATLSQVPLPPAALLFGTALLGLGVLGRRRKKELAVP